MKPRFRFSLKIAIGILTLTAFAAAYLSSRFDRARLQADAVASIRRDSEFNRCIYDYQTTDEFTFDYPDVDSLAESGIPAWLLDRFGIDFFHDVTFVEANYRHTSQENLLGPILSLGHVKQLSAWGLPAEEFPDVCNCKKLEFLDMGGSSVIDLPPIQNFKRLKHLSIWDTGVSDLKPISNLTKLEVLLLNKTPVKDLHPLAKLTNLERLEIRQTKVDDLSPISHLTKLKELKTSGTHLSSLQPLEKLTNLDTLDISIDSRNKGQLSSLSGLTKLRQLILSGEATEIIDDASFLTDLDKLVVLIIHDSKLEASNIRFLKGLKKLQHLSFSSTTISDNDVELLRQSLPICKHFDVNGSASKKSPIPASQPKK